MTAQSVLLVRPDPGNERFGLGPFFRVEPLALEYLGAALRRDGARVTVADLHFRPRLARVVAEARPTLVGITCLHALEYDRVIEAAREIRRLVPGVPIVVGGHAAAAYPQALDCEAIDAICAGDGEVVVREVARAVREGRSLDEVAGVFVRRGGAWQKTTSAPPVDMDDVALPARDLVERYRSGYRCLQHRPVWLVETARGCPFRCTFCAVWAFNERAFRGRAVGAVVEDFVSAGDRIFVIDDLFFYPPERSLELARALRRRGVHKTWILVQSRADLVARHPEVLEAWRDLADRLDIFFGFEAATDSALRELSKDASAASTVEAVKVARSLGVGVTGNFVIDTDWEEADFERLWAFVDEHKLARAGYTLLTPLPGTQLFEQRKERMNGHPWFKYDMHHALWRPRLGERRFFELYAETW
ncbi:MAG TPA: radical SAM protein, partial [Polyangiaceae bacterium]|nr:radical SAM protein [Polyangiaceae bacterium]